MPVSLDSVKAAAEHKVTPIEVPEWGGTIYARAMSALEWAEYADAREPVREGGGEPNAAAHLRNICTMLVSVLCSDELGSDPLFPNREEGLAMLGEQSQVLIMRLFAEITQANAADEKTIRELAGNLNGGRDDASPSVSPSH